MDMDITVLRPDTSLTVGFSKERALAYHKASSGLPDARVGEKREVKAALREMGTGEFQRVVELGAGQGFGTQMLLEHVVAENGTLFAIDASEHMLSNLKSAPQIRKFVGSIEQLGLEADSVDFAFSLAAFHHIPHKYLVFQELAKVLKPGAHFLIVDVCHGTPAQEIFDYLVRPHCPNGHDADFLDEGWAALLAQRSGLRHVSSKVRTTEWRFPSREAVFPYIKDLFCLDLDLAEVERETIKWLPVIQDVCDCVWPWSLGFHLFVKPEKDLV